MADHSPATPPMTQGLYDLWREEWKLERPGRIPPTFEQMNEIMSLMHITALDIFGIHEEELNA